MMPKEHDPLENILLKIEDLDKVSLNNLVSRLARERRFLHSVFNLLREGVLVISSSGVIEYANRAAAEMLGFALNDVGSAVLWKWVPDLRRTLPFNEDGSFADEASITREIELNYPERRAVRLYMVPFEEQSDGDRVDRIAVILSDITSEKTRTRKEIETERVRSILQLAAGVAHELGNPLNSLTIHLQLMERQLKRMPASSARDKLMHSLAICSGEVDRLDSIITHFLQAIRPSPPDLAEIDIVSVLEETLEFMGPELSSARVRVDIELESRLPAILADRNQLKQVFFNVLKNARQAMKSGGVIKVKAFGDDTFIYIQIGDTGVGIQPADLNRVFEPYYTTRKGGSGLGMMISERIVRDHGGQIGIDSRPGVGTVVTLQFPLKNRRVRLLE